MSNISDDISLSVDFLGSRLSSPIYNASGPRSGSVEALSKVANSSSSAIMAKSATCKEQTGNPLPRTFQSKDSP